MKNAENIKILLLLEGVPRRNQWRRWYQCDRNQPSSELTEEEFRMLGNRGWDGPYPVAVVQGPERRDQAMPNNGIALQFSSLLFLLKFN